MRTAVVMVVVLGAVAGFAATPMQPRGERKVPDEQEEKLRAAVALRFPALGAGVIPAGCFHAPKFTTPMVVAPAGHAAFVGVVWPKAHACSSPANVLNTAGGTASPHLRCVEQINKEFPHYLATYRAMEENMLSSTTADLREPRARTVIDLALAATVDKLRDLGHDGLVIEAEYHLGTNPGTHLPIPGPGAGVAATENWVQNFPPGCDAQITPLWGSPDYIVRDTNHGNRIVMVVEAKRFTGLNVEAEDQLIREMLAAAAANYWGQRALQNVPGLPPQQNAYRRGMAARYLNGVSEPRPGATGGTSHVAGVLSNGDQCHTIMLCGNFLMGRAPRIPVAEIANHNGGPHRFVMLQSCMLSGLLYALHGSPCT